MVKILGIDLGTSNSAAAIIMGGRPTIIPSAEGTSLGGKAFPSYVAFTKDGQQLIGEPARRQVVSNPEGTVYAIKRKMGTNQKTTLHGKEFTPQQISAFILQKVKRDAEAFVGEKIEKAVITVPAYFNDNQRQATKDAGSIAGFEVMRIINEPTAASLAYGLDKTDKDLKILVFDFGGGTLDVTIMDFGDGVFEVKSTSGDTKLGGIDMDKLLQDYIVDEFKNETGIDVSQDNTAIQRVREAVEKSKIELSTTLTTDINLPFISADASGPKHLTKTLTRAKLEEIVMSVVEKCKSPLKQAIKDAKLSTSDIDRVILVGGPTRMPLVKKFVEDFVGKKSESGVDPMECVALGAAIQGGVLAGDVKDILLLDVTPLSLGVETLGGVMTKLIERNTTIPTRKSQIFTTAADYQTTVTVHILQGERAMSADNVSLGMFNLEGIPPAAKGVPQIEVTYDIDANGIINVTAKDTATKKEQKITISASTKLSDEEKERMVNDAEKYSEEDKKRREEVEILNKAESLVYSAEKSKVDLKEKISKEHEEKLNKSISALKEVIKSKDAEKIKISSDELSKLLEEISAKVYQEAAAAAQQAAPEKPPEDEADKKNAEKEKVVEADYKVVDEDKKKKSNTDETE